MRISDWSSDVCSSDLINQQIQSLQNEASMLTNMAKNLSRISFAELTELTEKLRAVDQLMAAAQGIDFRIDTLDTQFKRLFPDNYDMVKQIYVRLASARAQIGRAYWREGVGQNG